MGNKKLNVIWFIVDSVRNYKTGMDDRDKLALMDKLSDETVEFRTVVTSAPSSVMSVAAMMTGCPAYFIARDYENFKFDGGAFPSLPQILKNKGYSIYSIIFYREGREKLINLLDQVDKKLWPKELKHSKKYWSNNEVNDLFFNLLDKGIREPFFLFVHYNIRLDKRTSQKVEMALNYLKKNSFYNRSVFILCSDHGYPDPKRGYSPEWFKKHGLTHDLVMSDDNTLIPLYIHYPGVTPASIDKTVSSLDIMPTVLDILGKELEEDKKFLVRGQSFLPLIENVGPPQNLEKRKIRVDARFLMQSKRATAIRNDHYKYIIFRDDNHEEFYDIKADPQEMNNIIDDHRIKEKLAEFREEFEQQESDAVRFHFQYIISKIRKNLKAKNIKLEKNKILVLDFSPLEESDIFMEVLYNALNASSLSIISNKEYKELEPNINMRQIFCGDLDNFKYKHKEKSISLAYTKYYDFLIVPYQDLNSPSHKKTLKLAKTFTAKNKVLINSNMEIDFQKRKDPYSLAKLIYSRRIFYIKEPSLILKDFVSLARRLLKPYLR